MTKNTLEYGHIRTLLVSIITNNVYLTDSKSSSGVTTVKKRKNNNI